MRPCAVISFPALRRAAARLVLLLLASPAWAHGLAEEDRSKYIEGGARVYAELGALHMLTGLDHLLFLFGVVFFLQRARDVVVLVTLFTLGHSLTLLTATWFQVRANPWAIDAVIALTVCYKAFDNLDGFRRQVGIASPNLRAAVFVFGLIHGFGLSTRLQELPLGRQSLLPRILSFNVGVELGQVAALLAIVGALALWRRRPSFATFARPANAALLVAGALLFLYQAHGYLHDTHAEDFPLNAHAHEHAHEEAGSPLTPPATAAITATP